MNSQTTQTAEQTPAHGNGSPSGAPFCSLLCGDCREILPTLDIPSDALFVVDPPYGIKHTSSSGSWEIKGAASWRDREIANDDSTELRDWIIEFADGRPMVIFGSQKVPRPPCRAVLIWDKGPQFGMGDLSFPWKASFEEIYILGDGWTGRRDEGVLRGYSSVTWESKGRRHPHEKPAKLMEHFIAKHTASVIVDPCCGSGPVLRAAKDCRRSVIGIEIDPEHVETARSRLAQGVLF